MFCKWCGNTMEASAQVCPACGREKPAMSDCGGFYDLVDVIPAAPTPAAEPPQPVPAEEPKKRALPLWLVAVMCVFLAAALILLCVMLSKVQQLQSGTDALQQELEQIEDRLEDLEELHPELTEPAETKDPGDVSALPSEGDPDGEPMQSPDSQPQ